nr:MAG TPA: hypothetical protein [Caudoviricetes sp.]
MSAWYLTIKIYILGAVFSRMERYNKNRKRN